MTKATWGKDEKPKEIFEQAVRHVFEQDEFWLPKQYDEYLKLEYGDYKKLPPVEKQVTHHEYDACWKE